MRRFVVPLLIFLIVSVNADLPESDSNAVLPSGYREYSFTVVADFTMKISGIAEYNLTLFLMSNDSYTKFLNQETFPSYLETNIVDEFEILFETGNYQEKLIHLVLTNLGNITCVYKIDIGVVQDTTEQIGNDSFVIMSLVVLISMSSVKSRLNKRSLIGKL